MLFAELHAARCTTSTHRLPGARWPDSGSRTRAPAACFPSAAVSPPPAAALGAGLPASRCLACCLQPPTPQLPLGAAIRKGRTKESSTCRLHCHTKAQSDRRYKHCGTMALVMHFVWHRRLRCGGLWPAVGLASCASKGCRAQLCSGVKLSGYVERYARVGFDVVLFQAATHWVLLISIKGGNCRRRCQRRARLSNLLRPATSMAYAAVASQARQCISPAVASVSLRIMRHRHLDCC